METRQSANFPLKDALFQIIAAAVAHSLAIHAGINMAFSTILLPQIMKNDSFLVNYEGDARNNTGGDDLLVDKDEASWIASLVTITTPIGSLLSGLLMDQFGRKAVCMLTAISLVVAWSTTALTGSHVYVLYIARALAGFGAGLSTVGLVYVSEISHASVRPMLLSLNSAFVSFGILLATLLAHVMSWRGLSWSCSALAIASFVIVIILPESPVWLSRIRLNDSPKRNARVLRSLKWFYRKPELLKIEFDSLIKISTENCDNGGAGTECENPLTNETKNSTQTQRKPSVWKPVLLLLGLFFLQQFSGGYLVIFYAIQIFQATGAMELDEWTSLILLGVIRFTMAFASAFLSRTIGRRKLLISSGAGMAAVMLLGSLSLLLPFLGSPVLQVVCILGFVSFSSFGFLVIPWTLIGELLPHRIRGRGSGLMISFAYLLMFATVKMFIYVLDLIGLGYMFLIFAVVSVLSVAYVHYFLPETLGKSFEEIEANF